MRNFLLCGGDDKNLVESFAWGLDLKCLDSIFLLPNAFSSYLNTINLKILKEKFMQSLSAFSLFFWFGPVLSSHDYWILFIYLAMVQSCGKDTH